MPWSANFLTALQSNPIAPRFRLDFFELSDSLSSSATFRSEGLSKGAVHIAGYDAIQQTVEPYPGRSSMSEWRVTLAGDMRGLLGDLVIGSHAQMMIGFPGWADVDFERDGIGRLKNVLRPNLSKHEFVLVFEPLPMSMQTRLTTDLGASYAPEDSKTPLFHNLREVVPATLLSAYTAGDGSLIVQLADDLSAFEKQEGAAGLVKVVPTGPGAADPFYLEFSSTGANLISLLATGGQRSTADASAAIGSEVYPVALLQGHPADIFRRVLTSTGGAIGTGTSGSGGDFDTLPESWGIDPNGVADDWLDHDDIEEWRDEVIVTSVAADPDYLWHIISETHQSNGGNWLFDHLDGSAIFVVQRQGDLTVRALQDLDDNTDMTNGLKTAGFTITDADILLTERGEIDGRWESRDSEQEFSSRTVHVLTGESAAGRSLYSNGENHMMPAKEVVNYDQSAVYFDGVGDYHESAGGDARRLACWHAQPREVLELRLSMRFAQYTVCDVGRLTTTALYGRFADTENGYDDHLVSILSHRVRWLPSDGPSVEVRLAIVRVEPNPD
ncbi:MAG: hypothetical protein ACI8RZ_007484 [Myxococcota bacterium]|jgi:hypothetical protein